MISATFSLNDTKISLSFQFESIGKVLKYIRIKYGNEVRNIVLVRA